MTIRIQAKPPTEKQTSKEERKPKQSEKTMKPCKMQSKGMKGKPNTNGNLNKEKAKQNNKWNTKRKQKEVSKGKIKINDQEG